jgi:hypothetical protein
LAVLPDGHDLRLQPVEADALRLVLAEDHRLAVFEVEDVVGLHRLVGGVLVHVVVDDLLTHDAHAEEPTLAYLLSRFKHDPRQANPFPEPVGVFRDVRKPTYEEMLDDRIKASVEKRGPGKIEELFKAEDVWTVS